jgi:hypothetical protein
VSRAALLAGLGAATAVAAVAAWRELSCSSCSGGALPLGVLGTGFYACCLVATTVFGPRRPVALLLIGAFGLHLGLVALMVMRGPFCVTCLLAAGASGVVTTVVLWRERELVETAIALVPWTAAAAFALPVQVAPREVPSAPGAQVQIAVYTRDGCAYCDRLRDEVLPQALEGLDGRVEVRWIAAPPGTATPAIIVSRGPGGKYIEGLPPVDFLRREVVKRIEGTP